MIARSIKLATTVGAAVIIALVIAVPTAQTGAPPKCFGKVATILGDNGDDDINGTNGNDVIDRQER